MDENPYQSPCDTSGLRPPTLEELAERAYTKDTIWLLITAVVGFVLLFGAFAVGQWVLEYFGLVQ